MTAAVFSASHQRSSFLWWLDKAVLAAILGNAGILLWGLIDHSHEDLIGTLDELVLWFFALEIAIRVKRAGRRFYADKWLLFDAVVVVVALAPVGADVMLLRLVRACRLAHFGRHLPHVLSLRLLTRHCADTVPTVSVE
jgi:voltage-gated sodium channel